VVDEHYFSEKIQEFEERLQDRINRFKKNDYYIPPKSLEDPWNDFKVIGRFYTDFEDALNFSNFIKNIFQDEYIQNIISFASERNVKLIFPHELVGDYDIGLFAYLVFRNKNLTHTDFPKEYGSLTFEKILENKRGTFGYLASIHILNFPDSQDLKVIKDNVAPFPSHIVRSGIQQLISISQRNEMPRDF